MVDRYTVIDEAIKMLPDIKEVKKTSMEKIDICLTVDDEVYLVRFETYNDHFKYDLAWRLIDVFKRI